jgi:ATP-dependent Lhr-like helicase
VVEAVLAELASAGFLQRHGYKNRYGANDELHKLVDTKLIYGNFAVGSQTVDLFHGSKLLGEIPAMNLLRIRRGGWVRFAGKCWQVTRVSHEGIHLVPSRSSANVVDFSFGGGGAPSDPELADRMWRLIHSDELPTNLFVKNLRDQVERFRNQVRRTCSEKTIPFRRSSEGIRYYTFAGQLVNRAIGLFAKKPGFQAEELSLLVPSPIDWASIPSQPLAFEDYFHLLFEASSGQSLYQKQLPLDLQEREYLQDWLKAAAIPRILSRISNATPIGIKGFESLH